MLLIRQSAGQESGCETALLGSILARSLEVYGKPNCFRIPRSADYPMPSACRYVHEITLSKANGGPILESNFGGTFKYDYPFILLLVIPSCIRGGMSFGNDAFNFDGIVPGKDLNHLFGQFRRDVTEYVSVLHGGTSWLAHISRYFIGNFAQSPSSGQRAIRTILKFPLAAPASIRQAPR